MNNKWIRFPERVRVQTENGKYYTRPATPEDRERREAVMYLLLKQSGVVV